MGLVASRQQYFGYRPEREILVAPDVMRFEAFFRDEYPKMVSLARAVCGDFEMAEDLAQEAMSRAHRNWSKVSAYERPGAWIRRVTINLAISRRRGQLRHVSVVNRAGSDLRLVSEVDVADQVTEHDAPVWAAVRQLAPKQRAAITLFYQEDMSTREIAEILECSISTATSHLSQARGRLAKLLETASSTATGERN